MTYSLLGQNLYETADLAKKYFSQKYGAKNFKCESAINDLPLKPTWQATASKLYCLCIEVRDKPFSGSLYEFVTKCATKGIPVRLWVAMPQKKAGPNFNAELKQARETGIGVVQIAEDGTAHEFHRPVDLSLFALKKTDLKLVPANQREYVKSAEDTFLDGSPDAGCQEICQALEQITRKFAEETHRLGWWRHPPGGKALTTKFFQVDSWAKMLQTMEERLETAKAKSKCPSFTMQLVIRARGHTQWRNDVSHKPKTFKQLQSRDAKLRSMFEVTRDLLVDWYPIGRSFNLLK